MTHSTLGLFFVSHIDDVFCIRQWFNHAIADNGKLFATYNAAFDRCAELNATDNLLVNLFSLGAMTI